MRILFIGIQPSSALKSVLLTPPYQVEFQKTLKAIKFHPELVVFRASQKGSLAQLKRIKKAHPHAWIAVVVTSAQLHHTDFYETLLRQEAKDSVWLEETWELLFWPSLQQIARRKSELQGLMAKSAKLVERFEKNLELALNVQRALLPQRHPEIPGINILTKYMASTGVGGDYYDIFEFGDKRRFGFLLADSKTHGMAAALLSVLLKVRLDELKERFPDSQSLMDHIQREIPAHPDGPGSQMALLYGIIDRATLEFRFTSVGHLTPHVWRQGKAVPVLASTHESTIALKPGDILLLFTDGFWPVFDKWGGGFTKTQDPMALRNLWMSKIDEYADKKKLTDDITVIQITIDQKLLFLAS